MSIEILILTLMRLERIKHMIDKTETVSNLCAYDGDISEMLCSLHSVKDDLEYEVFSYFEQPHLMN